MLAALQSLPPRSIVLLHACCHNPTGVDLSAAQWSELIPVIHSRQLIPYLDMAYQGFGDGLAQDAHALRALTEAGITESDVDRVFLTGGTSFVPAVRAQFEDRFGAAKIETGDQLVSIAYGLSLIGREADIARWAV
jgi:aspartate/tyrosine/aromatic aminotransferase